MTTLRLFRRPAGAPLLATTAALVLLLTVTGCGGNGDSGAAGSTPRPTASSPATGAAASPTAASGLAPSSKAAVLRAMDAWAAASTPAQACAVASVGFATFIGGGQASRCEAGVPKVLGPLATARARVASIRLEDGQVLVRASTPPTTGATVYYFVPEHGTWKLNSIGARHEAIS